MRVALGVSAFATVFIGVFPDRFIQVVNWSLNIANAPTIARLIR
jgi:hypothetical protein